MIIGGQHVEASDHASFPVYDPSTHEQIDSVPSAAAEDVERMLSIAQHGCNDWGRKSVEERCAVLRTAASCLYDAREKIADLICREQGKIRKLALDEAVKASQLFLGYAEKAQHWYGHLLPDNGPDMIVVRREPIGVVACVIPFNFPAELFAQKVAPALAAGNSVVVKPASDTPLTDLYLVELLLSCGIPETALQIVTGSGNTIGRILSTSDRIQAISLTGSTQVGVDIACSAAKNLTRTFLELGGNDAMIVLDDADLDRAAEEAVAARIYNAGQVCCSTKRCVVHSAVADAFIERVLARMKHLHTGSAADPSSDLGPLINESAALEAECQVAETIALGARCLLGGHHFNQTYFEPTVLADVTPDMPIARDLEVFAPVIPIIKFETDEQAVNIVNASCYGLSGGVMTKNVARGIQLACQIDAGGVIVGGAGMYRTNDMPFGGHKKSGLGTEGFYATLEEMVKTKSIVLRNVLPA